MEKASGRKVHSMIAVALEELEQKVWQRIGLLGLGEPRVYIKSLQEMGKKYLTLKSELQEKLDGAIFSIMEGRDGEEEQSAAEEAIESFWREGADGIILGCTEIPLLLNSGVNAEDLINPAQLLAKAVVEYSMD